ncbi:hypothetical protein H6F76_18275 [Leptolyngbya sp. FACHB-321]|uniref:hypothetical protein n=1 Tax=Leptolyngbya sp. FACHB-321 TaxID=2692807 RepID=UPI001685A6DA|nr:hypothetical protein [Leptolyngbya sp. FACHB-321]MBD2036957.1 hypothetical protein [Leptolyngbya sp. FACHB-321]
MAVEPHYRLFGNSLLDTKAAIVSLEPVLLLYLGFATTTLMCLGCLNNPRSPSGCFCPCSEVPHPHGVAFP